MYIYIYIAFLLNRPHRDGSIDSQGESRQDEWIGDYQTGEQKWGAADWGDGEGVVS